jgi:hypothetical protein
VIEVADVFRRFAGDYLSAHGASMPPSHRRAIADIQACRTEALGGGLWRCDQCSAEVFSYRSCTSWGEGEPAVLDYLARYVFRVALTNTRIVGLDDEAVTIRHKHRKSNRWRARPIPGQEFMRRFLQHVLPKGLHKVRYFGLWHPAKRESAARARLLLQLDRSTKPRPAETSANAAHPNEPQAPKVCPCCRTGLLRFIRQFSPRQAQGR